MTELKVEPYEIPAADVGPENPLPVFRGPEDDTTVGMAPSLPEEDRRYLGWRTGFRALPHRMQDGYTREKRHCAFQAVVLENEHLRATFLAEVGGRLVSLETKPDGRELLDRNPVFQPANLALRNAWFSGGVEWNTGHFGHHYLTCSPVFAARVDGPNGWPVLRLYEWERVKQFPWQIDFCLPPGSPFLFSRVRLLNPHTFELPMYWWTNMAVEERPGRRTVVPADDAIHPTAEGFGVDQLPDLAGFDATYSTNHPGANEMFFRIPAERRKWVAALDPDGSGFVQTSSDRLRGRKMFVWGTGRGGRRWQEYLAAPGRAYLEIQAGLARTQIEHVPMPAGAEWTWVEAFGPLQADPGRVHGEWGGAWRAVDEALEAALPRGETERVGELLGVAASQPPCELLWHGSGWGALERRRAAQAGAPPPVPDVLMFPDADLGAEQEPWLRLLEERELPSRDPDEDPGSYMVQPEWRALLEQAVAAGRGDHWLSWLHLGVMRLEERDEEGARQAWLTSLERHRTGWALRNLAVLATRQGNRDEACDLLGQAWEAGPECAALAVERVEALHGLERFADALGFIDGLPAAVRGHERITLAEARAALEVGEYARVEPVFGREFATIREGEVTLSNLWFQLHERKLAAVEGRTVDDAIRERVRREFPPPERIDYRMSAEKEG